MERFMANGCRNAIATVSITTSQLYMNRVAVDLARYTGERWAQLSGDHMQRIIEVRFLTEPEAGAVTVSANHAYGGARVISILGFSKWFNLNDKERGRHRAFPLNDAAVGLRVDLTLRKLAPIKRATQERGLATVGEQ